LFNIQCLKFDNLIMGRDINFTLNRRELWRDSAMVDHLADFLINIFEVGGLVDVEPIKFRPS
jgi:hypothetical protein